jgi:hypothetical protein
VATERSPVGGRSKPKALVAGEGYHAAATTNIPVNTGGGRVTAQGKCTTDRSTRMTFISVISVET